MLVVLLVDLDVINVYRSLFWYRLCRDYLFDLARYLFLEPPADCGGIWSIVMPASLDNEDLFPSPLSMNRLLFASRV